MSGSVWTEKADGSTISKLSAGSGASNMRKHISQAIGILGRQGMPLSTMSTTTTLSVCIHHLDMKALWNVTIQHYCFRMLPD